MTGPTLPERLHDAGLSAWELGDLLGIHPHLVGGLEPPLLDRPAQVLLEIARRLDAHPADLVPEFQPLLRRRRQAPADPCGGQDQRADALTVLTALATARARSPPTSSAAPWDVSCRAPRPPSPATTPTSAARWCCGGSRPKPGPVTPRLDILTETQRHALRDTTTAAVARDNDQARVLLAALAAGQSDTYAELRARPGWAAAETALKETGLMYSSTARTRSTSATTSDSAFATATTTT